MENVLVVVDGFDAQTQEASPELLWMDGCQGVRRALRACRVRMVATPVSLPDGNWYTLLRELVNAGSTASLIVCSPNPDEALRRHAVSCGADFAICELRPEKSVAAQRHDRPQAA